MWPGSEKSVFQAKESQLHLLIYQEPTEVEHKKNIGTTLPVLSILN